MPESVPPPDAFMELISQYEYLGKKRGKIARIKVMLKRRIAVSEEKLHVDNQTLEGYAESCASKLRITGKKSARTLSRAIRARLYGIKNVFDRVYEFSSKTQIVPQEFEWLMDNWYLSEREGKEAMAALRRRTQLERAEGESFPALFTLAQKLISASKNRLDTGIVRAFLNGAQKARPFSERELWLTVPIFKGALIFEIERLCSDIGSELSDYRKPAGENPFSSELAASKARASGTPINDELEELAATARRKHDTLSSLIGSAFTSLRFLSTADLNDLLHESSEAEKILSKDPAGIYHLLDERTRGYYRHEVSRLAKKHGMSEHEAASRALELSKKGKGLKKRHVGYFIFSEPLGKAPGHADGKAYIWSIISMTVLLTAVVGALTGSGVLAFLLLLPISEIVKNSADFLAVRLKKPAHIPRLELKGGIPEEGRTLCVISALLTGKEKGHELASLLERYRVANRDAGECIRYGLLADLPDSQWQETESDRETISAARDTVSALNEKYGGGFFLFARRREMNESHGRYMGWERKRGAITDLISWINSGKDVSKTLQVLEGEADWARNARYLITLDADTRLNAGAARELVGAMLHPLNGAVIDEERGVVTSGYGILQPRISVELESANRSLFSRIFAGQGGIDPYGSASSDVYQDLFGEGIFTGKGIIDIRAFAACSSFPENSVLSHDLLEGAYLRAGFMGDMELSDGYPFKVSSYYDRMHRWIRGDWQAAPWLFGKVKNSAGKQVRNPISPVSRWKLFDNLRRSLVPILTFLGLYSSMFISTKSFALLGIAALFCLFSRLFLCGTDLLFRKHGRTVRYHSTIITGFFGVFMQTAVQILFLPFEAVVAIHAIGVSLYRMLISRRNMLQWVTASESESARSGGAAFFYRKMMPCALFGVIGLMLCPFLAAKGLSVLWIFSPVFASMMSRRTTRQVPLDKEDAAFLREQAALIWKYFETFLTKEEHFLPPDNYQEQPAAGIAHRTSPTNIGLAMLSAMSAFDIGIIPKEKMLYYVEAILGTIESIPKWNGHLLNWYDTLTLHPLRPRCVSTVDSGNLSACLTALTQGLLEMEDAEARQLALRAEKLNAEMSFAPLYDSKRRLFHIGYDIEKDAPTSGFYDLLASEARQTSYIAVARGEVDRRHWRKLGRALVTMNGYSGMASWTGTMFEYLMPNLLMPMPENSLIYESARFCVYCHQKHGQRRGVPWGISESAFFSFDPQMNYQYKAHGVQKLGLKRGLDRELVISPYSTFLALLVRPFDALINLKKLQKLGLVGRFGYCEAADFTYSRLSEGVRFEPVRCYMSHHIGMSMLAVDNLLNRNIMQRRFMRDTKMGAFRELLEEKVPVGAPILRVQASEVPEKPKRVSGDGWTRESSGFDAWSPRSHLLTNGSYTVFSTDTGLSSSNCAGLQLNRFEARQYGGVSGIYFFIRRRDELISLQPAPFYEPSVKYSASFDGSSARISSTVLNLRATCETRVCENDNAEQRAVTVSNFSTESEELELICYFEPVLARKQDFEAHPAFSRLSIETEAGDMAVTIKRRGRGESKDVFMSFACSHGASIDTSRELTLGRGGIDSLRSALSRPSARTQGAVLDPCVFTRTRLMVEPNESVCVRFSLAVASGAVEAQNAAQRALSYSPRQQSGRIDGAISLLKLSNTEVTQAFDMLTDMVFITHNRRNIGPMIEKNTRGQQALWKFAVSGDLPIIAVRADSQEAIEKLPRVLRQHRFLSQCGMDCDLAVIVRDGADYRQPTRGLVFDTLRAFGSEGTLSARGGVHILDIPEKGGEDETLLLGVCSVFLDLDRSGSIFQTERSHTRPKNRAAYEQTVSEEHERPARMYLPDGSFSFETGRSMPPTAWSHVLANRDFGFLVTDAGGGHIWRKNSRENKITPWTNDPLALKGPETLILLTGNSELSLFASNDGVPATVRYGFGFASWEKRLGDGASVTTTAFVPPDIPARVYIVEARGLKGGDSLRYCAELQLGHSAGMSRHVVSKYNDEKGELRAFSHYNVGFSPQTVMTASSPKCSYFTCDLLSFLEGRMDGACGGGLFPCAAISVPLERRGDLDVAVIVTGCAADEGAEEAVRSLYSYDKAKKALEMTRAHWNGICSSAVINTPDANLNGYMNGWSVYQTLACRVYARASLYQCGGAFGFRDQLQDSCALLYASPETTRELILNASMHQFEEGDVQHWWHPANKPEHEGDKGVRTRITDDLLFLPYAVCEYIEKTGDMDILDIETPFIVSERLRDDEHERYETPLVSDKKTSIYLHCVRALEMVMERGYGANGLCLIGGGDWNDGFNLVGVRGKGESTWLSWFFSHVLERFSRLCASLGDEERAERYLQEAATVSETAKRAWDGEYFIRGYFDDGTPLGASECDECSIDSIAQSFSALAYGADMELARTAVRSAVKKLVDYEGGLIKLFTPPFYKTDKNPGYIKSYLAGVRENGGQYTHAAVWLCMACFECGFLDEGQRLLSLLLPSTHPEGIYRAEPYVLAADVYSNPLHVGRGGWSWYTGASAWYYRVCLEYMLGIKASGGELLIAPRLPSSWQGFEASVRIGGARYSIRARRGEKQKLLLDGSEAERIELRVDGEHEIECYFSEGQDKPLVQNLKKRYNNPVDN